MEPVKHHVETAKESCLFKHNDSQILVCSWARDAQTGKFGTSVRSLKEGDVLLVPNYIV